MTFIETTEDLKAFCEKLQKEKFITVDLEFLREHSYYAKLCLIQIGSLSDSAIVDPLAPDINLQAFLDLMQNENITKVFHSGRQDIEIIYNLCGKIPAPLFDTQVAAMVCGFGEAASYESLVAAICRISLDKTSRLSDWSRRPLNETQLQYALSDVTHLIKIYQYLDNELQKNKRGEWISEEMDILSNPETYQVKPFEVWKKIKHRSHNPHFLTILRELAAWREKRSMRKNTPRQSLIKDEMLLNIAAANPHSAEELEQTRGIRKDIATGKLAGEILEVICKCDGISPKDYVSLPAEATISHGCTSLCDLLRLLLKIRSQAEGIVPRLIAADDDLKAFSCFHDKNNPILKGWRKKIFGDYALALRNGELHIAYNPQTKKIEFTGLN